MEFWEYNEHTVDDKGRLVLPASFRVAFEPGGVLTYQGTYVALFEPSGWERALRRMEASGDFTRPELNYVKSFVTPFVPDKQFRVTLPARLREAVGLEREVALIGMGGHVALYPRQVWKDLEAQLAAGADGRPALGERLSVML